MYTMYILISNKRFTMFKKMLLFGPYQGKKKYGK